MYRRRFSFCSDHCYSVVLLFRQIKVLLAYLLTYFVSGADYYKFKYRKTMAQMLEYEEVVRPNQINYKDAAAPPSAFPKRSGCNNYL